MNSTTANFNIMSNIARNAGNSLLRDFTEVQRLVSSIAGTERLTKRAQVRTEKLIREELENARPAYGFVGSNSYVIIGEDPTRRWLVCAICGEINFAHGIPHWAVSIALEHKSKIYAAVLYDPFNNEMFRSESGRGAYVNDVRLRVSRRSNESNFVISAARTAEISPINLSLLSKKVKLVRCSGNLALDFVYVAAGRYDGCIGYNLNSIETASARMILLESGGLAAPLQGNTNEQGTFIAAGVEIFDRFSSMVESIMIPI